MLYNNYVQALNLIKKEHVDIEVTLAKYNYTEADLEAWAKEEADYVEALSQESPYDMHTMMYVELLQEWQCTQTEYMEVTEELFAAVPANY
ncbi:hypothetical protein NM688_g1763 [Phlebia brevispora]|uniref:Uncharacterized protein n=1 Tax=Phlebia brevispora TaxID=194682 RepID=A0ACC1TAS0_9APHY|nr:hypothetical protein NM688_g1763 [Phlebia brevispora]